MKTKRSLTLTYWASAIAQWICLRLPTCGPGFESQAQQVRLAFFNLNLNCNVKCTKIKQKEDGIDPYFL